MTTQSFAILIQSALARGWIHLPTPPVPTDPITKLERKRAYQRALMRRYRLTNPRQRVKPRKTNVRRCSYPPTADGQRAYQRDIMRALRAQERRAVP